MLISTNFLETSFYFFVKQVVNPPYLRKSKYQPILKTRLKPNFPLFLDRHIEFKNNYKLTLSDLVQIWMTYGIPSTPDYSNSYMRDFEKSSNDHRKLKKTYEKHSMLYAYRLMMTYERFSLIAPYFDQISKHLIKQKAPIIIDYGCGVADISLTLAKLLDIKVILVDLDDSKLKFAKERFIRRNIPVTTYALKDVQEIPEIKTNSISLIIATEVLEHVPDPLKLTKSFYRWLSSEGLLFNSMGKHFERNLRGDHLKEALEIGNSITYKQYYDSHFQQIHIKDIKDSFVFKKHVK